MGLFAAYHASKLKQQARDKRILHANDCLTFNWKAAMHKAEMREEELALKRREVAALEALAAQGRVPT